MTEPVLVVVVLGVSGSGKTTIGQRVADRVGWAFADADDFHPPANVEKMRSGLALDDTDRGPWLDDLRAWVSERETAGSNGVLTCSCLKRAYRDLVAEANPAVFFVELDVSRDVLAQRVARRSGHFMPASLLDSQLETLQPLQPDERGARIPADGPIEEVVDRVLAVLPTSRAV